MQVLYNDIVEIKQILENFKVDFKVVVFDRSQEVQELAVIDWVNDNELISCNDKKTYSETLQITYMIRQDVGSGMHQSRLAFKQFIRENFNVISSYSYSDEDNYYLDTYDINVILKGLDNIE